jgi:hypothetical protein
MIRSMINEDELPGFLFLKIRGEIRGLLDGMARNVAVFRYGAKKETYTGQRNTGPVRHALTMFQQFQLVYGFYA